MPQGTIEYIMPYINTPSDGNLMTTFAKTKRIAPDTAAANHGAQAVMNGMYYKKQMEKIFADAGIEVISAAEWKLSGFDRSKARLVTTYNLGSLQPRYAAAALGTFDGLLLGPEKDGSLDVRIEVSSQNVEGTASEKLPTELTRYGEGAAMGVYGSAVFGVVGEISFFKPHTRKAAQIINTVFPQVTLAWGWEIFAQQLQLRAKTAQAMFKK